MSKLAIKAIEAAIKKAEARASALSRLLDATPLSDIISLHMETFEAIEGKTTKAQLPILDAAAKKEAELFKIHKKQMSKDIFTELADLEHEIRAARDVLFSLVKHQKWKDSYAKTVKTE